MPSNAVKQDVERQASALGFTNIEQSIGDHLAGRDPEIVAMIKKHVKEMDADGDGRVTSPELARYSTNLVDEVMAAKEKNRRLRWYAGGATGLVVLLSGGVFGSSAAAAFLAKDTHVKADRVLRTKSNGVVDTGIAETAVAAAALAWLPNHVVSHLDTVTFQGKEGGVYNRKISGSFINPKKEMVITTFEGDTLAWTIEDKMNVVVTLEDGTSWTKHVACERCTMTNVATSDAIERGLAEFLDVVGEADVDGNGRLLRAALVPNFGNREEYGGLCPWSFYPVQTKFGSQCGCDHSMRDEAQEEDWEEDNREDLPDIEP